MTRSPRPRTNLTDSLHRQLNMYALAAGGAGVAVLAMAQPAAAEIVYTPADIRLGHGIIHIDLNHDGIVDFELCGAASTNSSCSRQWLSVRPQHGQNAIVGYVGKTPTSRAPFAPALVSERPEAFPRDSISWPRRAPAPSAPASVGEARGRMPARASRPAIWD